MCVFKWSPVFHVDKSPQWCLFDFSYRSFLCITSIKNICFKSLVYWEPLFADSATIFGLRPSMARVCIEIDLLKPFPSRVWIGNGDFDEL